MKQLKETTTKITVTISIEQYENLDVILKRLFIKRDDFVNHMIKIEVPKLVEELAGRSQSAVARRHIAAQLKKMGTRKLNIVVEKETAKALNEVANRCNMVRDAFLNRLFLLLESSDWLLAHLDLPDYVTGSNYETTIPQPIATSPLAAIEMVYMDPLNYLRLAAEERYACGLYLLELPPKYAGFSCHLDDSDVPGTKEYVEAQELGEKLLEKLLKKVKQNVSTGTGKPTAISDGREQQR
jgi:hypothetical protein